MVLAWLSLSDSRNRSADSVVRAVAGVGEVFDSLKELGRGESRNSGSGRLLQHRLPRSPCICKLI